MTAQFKIGTAVRESPAAPRPDSVRPPLERSRAISIGPQAWRNGLLALADSLADGFELGLNPKVSKECARQVRDLVRAHEIAVRRA